MMDQAKVRSALHYDPQTGSFTWRRRSDRSARWNGKWAGKAAGYEHGCRGGPYLRITIDGREYPAHCLAFLYMTGTWPENQIDHRDRNGLNNRWRNLRPATRSQNRANSGARSDNKLGVKGVITSRSGRFIAQIQVSGGRRYLGTFDTPEEAGAAYERASVAHFGMFSVSLSAGEIG